MSTIYIWLIAYAMPALIAGSVVKLLPEKKGEKSKRNALIMHVALIISICLSQYFIYAHHQTFPWQPNVLSIAAYILSILLATLLLGQIGLWYGLSSLIQQLTILSAAFLLLPVYPFYMAALLIVPLYVWCHLLRASPWIFRWILFLAWGTASIFIFSIMPDIFLIAALHALFGSFLISRSIIYPRS